MYSKQYNVFSHRGNPNTSLLSSGMGRSIVREVGSKCVDRVEHATGVVERTSFIVEQLPRFLG